MVAHHLGTVPGLATPELAHDHPVDLAPLGAAAAHAVVTRTSKKAPDAANVGGPSGTETQYLISEQITDNGKRFATLRAHLALKGYCLHRTEANDGPVRFFVARWGMVRELRDLPAVAQFLRRVGGTYA